MIQCENSRCRASDENPGCLIVLILIMCFNMTFCSGGHSTRRDVQDVEERMVHVEKKLDRLLEKHDVVEEERIPERD